MDLQQKEVKMRSVSGQNHKGFGDASTPPLTTHPDIPVWRAAFAGRQYITQENEGR